MKFRGTRDRKKPNNKRSILLIIVLLIVIYSWLHMDEIMERIF